MILKPKASSFKTHYAEDITEQMVYATSVSPDDIFKSRKELRKKQVTQRKAKHAS